MVLHNSPTIVQTADHTFIFCRNGWRGSPKNGDPAGRAERKIQCFSSLQGVGPEITLATVHRCSDNRFFAPTPARPPEEILSLASRLVNGLVILELKSVEKPLSGLALMFSMRLVCAALTKFAMWSARSPNPLTSSPVGLILISPWHSLAELAQKESVLAAHSHGSYWQSCQSWSDHAGARFILADARNDWYGRTGENAMLAFSGPHGSRR